MKRAAHTGTHAETCAACITRAERDRMPWHRDHLDVIARDASGAYQRRHDVAMRRKPASAPAVPFVDVQHETCGDGQRLTLSRVIRVF